MITLRRLATGIALFTLADTPAAESGLFPTVLPGTGYAAFDLAPLTVLTPREQAEALRPLAARAAQLYRHLAADAGVEARPLTLVLTDDFDAHNGFSSVAPDNLVVVWLAPAPPRSGIFDGGDHRERTIVHELAHHLSNDRSHGVRKALETVFGRVLPSEPLSMLWAYLTVPAHVTMPSFWHEGVAQWAETAYADPSSPWAGRGRDSLTHAVWRLDAQAGAIPDAADWRPGWHAWPYGNRVYLYGLAYTRWLTAAYGRQASVWALVDAQARAWPFLFDDGVDAVLRRSHASLLAEARASLLAEQHAALATLRSRPLTVAPRLTPPGRQAGAPAWMPDGRLATALVDPWGKDRIALVDGGGRIETLRLGVMRDTEVRSLPDGTWVYADSVGLTPRTLSASQEACQQAAWQVTFARSRVVLVEPGGRPHLLDGTRLTQPDVRRDGDGWEVAAVRFLEGGGQELVRCRVAADGHQTPWTAIPTRDRPWSPAFRPGGGMAWVETHAGGSRLVLVDAGDAAARRLIAEVRGRILHPAWEADGAGLFLCADHTGVPNAWHLRIDHPGELVAVTNTVGAITACVPSPDGSELALLALDRDGPHVSRIANRPREWPGEIPAIPLAWPAPARPLAAAVPPASPKHPTPLPASSAELAPPAGDYQGLTAIRPLFWTPTTQVTAHGGYGVAGVAADPLRQHEVVVAAGAGAAEGSAIGQASWLVAPWPLQIQALAWRDERAYDDRRWGVVSGRTYDYVENVSGGELRLGEGLAGTQRRAFAYVAAGMETSRSNRDAVRRYAQEPTAGDEPFIGDDRYLDVVAGYASTTLFPTSYSREDGSRVALSWRHSGFGGDLEGERLLALGSYVLSVWPDGGHQLVAGGAVGWSAGPRSYLQGRFQLGGPSSGIDLPRGYSSLVATGDHLLAWSGGYRLPVWRPWAGLGTTPFALRQVVLEGFLDAAKASSDHPGGDGWWYRSTGGELRFNLEIWAMRLNPGLGVARQLDGREATESYFTLEYAR